MHRGFEDVRVIKRTYQDPVQRAADAFEKQRRAAVGTKMPLAGGAGAIDSCLACGDYQAATRNEHYPGERRPGCSLAHAAVADQTVDHFPRTFEANSPTKTSPCCLRQVTHMLILLRGTLDPNACVPHNASNQRPSSAGSDCMRLSCAFVHFRSINAMRSKHTLAGMMDDVRINDGDELRDL